jgi:hypothetical protein
MSCGPVIQVTLRYETVCSLRWWLASFAGSTLLPLDIVKPATDAAGVVRAFVFFEEDGRRRGWRRESSNQTKSQTMIEH